MFLGMSWTGIDRYLHICFGISTIYPGHYTITRGITSSCYRIWYYYYRVSGTRDHEQSEIRLTYAQIR